MKRIIAFLRSVKVELALTKWPNRQETMRLTIVVIATTLLVGAYIGGLDILFTNILSKLITK